MSRGWPGGQPSSKSSRIQAIDCLPSALSAATAVLLTVHPQMLDVMSMCQFLLMTSNLPGVTADAGANMGYDWLRYPLTWIEPGDRPQNQIFSFVRAMFGAHVLNAPHRIRHWHDIVAAASVARACLGLSADAWTRRSASSPPRLRRSFWWLSRRGATASARRVDIFGR
jgi:hypothetical protein